MEWKFARTKLWLNYVEISSALPVPFNLIPTPSAFYHFLRSIACGCYTDGDDGHGKHAIPKSYEFIQVLLFIFLYSLSRLCHTYYLASSEPTHIEYCNIIKFHIGLFHINYLE